MRRQRGKEDRPGWVIAPPIVEAEIRAVWQEDELPAEMTQAPGFRPFMLGLDAQEWVDSMTEIVDGGKAVYGRPKPTIPIQHRQLTTSPPTLSTPPPVTRQPALPPANYRPLPPPRPRLLMPDIDDAPAPAVPRPLMPDISEPAPPPKPQVLMPDINESSPLTKPHVLMPDIDDTLPPRPRTLPRRVLMPDIGGEPQRTEQKPPSMPEIG